MPTVDRFDQRQLSDTTRHARAKPVVCKPQHTTTHISHYPDHPVQFAGADDVSHHLLVLTPSYGVITAFHATITHMMVGMARGVVFGFDYRQQLRFKLDSELTAASAVTAIGTSADGDIVGVGYANGYVLLWHLPQFSADHSEPWHVIAPTTLQHRFSKTGLGHVSVAIDSILFLQHSHTQVVCSDRLGLVFYHHLVRTSYLTLFSNDRLHPTISTKVYGTNDANHTNAKFDILATAVLPLGLTHQVTDDLGVVAILTRTKLTVMLLLSLNITTKVNVRPVWSVERTLGAATRGSVDWLPCTRTTGSSSSEVVNARLCYLWNDTVTVAEVNNRHIPPNWLLIILEARDKDKACPPVTMTKTAKWRGPPGSISVCRWISPNLLIAGTPALFRVLYYDGSLREVVTQGLPLTSLPTPLSLLPTPSEISDSTTLPVTSLTVCKQRVVRLVDGTVDIGYVLNWADWIGQLLAQLRYHDAFTIVRELYNLNDDAIVALFGVERDLTTRHQQLRPFLLRILVLDDLEVTLDLVVAIVADLMADGAVSEGEEVLQRWFDRSDDTDSFFAQLEPYLISGAITSLPPEVLQALVRYYVVKHEGILLTEILTGIDLSGLDIDLTIQLARDYQLEECLVYVWTRLLHDYTTPLLRFYHEAKPGLSQVFTYMLYILTGRQYPTDQFIADADEELRAKRAVVDVVFADHSVDGAGESGDADDALFPYLTRFLHLDSRQMLRTLNAFFEDSYLNQGPLLRQYVVDALLDIFDTDASFTDDDRTHLAIFLGRNYPKYSQFLRLSELVMTRIVDTLIGSGSADVDIELALQSMLSVYHPKHTDHLVAQLQLNQFYGVLAGMYRSQGLYGKALEMLLKYHQGPQMLALTLETAFIHTRNHPQQRLALCHTISTHFGELVDVDIDAVVTMVSKYAPDLHQQATTLPQSQQYAYLQHLSPVPPALVGVYVRLASQCDDPQTVYDVVKRYQGRITDDDVMDQLKADHHLDAMALLTDDFDQLLSLVSQSIEANTDTIIGQRVLAHATSHCRDPQQWLRLINLLVSHTEAYPSVVKAIHECFREINSVDSRQTITDPDQPSMFITVLQQFLGQTTNAQLASVRGVLQEVVVLYSYELELLGISLRMLGSLIGHSQQIISDHTLQGMVVKCDHCTYCTKPLWDNHGQYVAWEQRHLRAILPGPATQETMVVMRNSVVVVFACGHGYHQGCLIQLNGGKANSQWSCLVCCQD